MSQEEADKLLSRDRLSFKDSISPSLALRLGFTKDTWPIKVAIEVKTTLFKDAKEADLTAAGAQVLYYADCAAVACYFVTVPNQESLDFIRALPWVSVIRNSGT